MRAIKRIICILFLAVTGMVVSQHQPAFGEYHRYDIRLIGSWSKVLNTSGSYGSQSPYMPDAVEFFMDQTLTMPNFGGRHLPFKTTLTRVERHVTEERNPDFKGKNLLLVLPDQSFYWVYTPMVYSYFVDKNDLTLIVHGWPPAKFTRVVK